MNTIDYPLPGFIKKGKTLANKHADFIIHINDKRKKKVFLKSVPFLFADNGKMNSVFNTIKMFISLFSFLVVHFYAQGVGYKPNYRLDDTLVVIYSIGNDYNINS